MHTPVQKRQWWKSNTIGSCGAHMSCSRSRSRTLYMLARSSFSTVRRACSQSPNYVERGAWLGVTDMRANAHDTCTHIRQ